MEPPFSQYARWLSSPEYKVRIAALIGEPGDPPRSQWPINAHELAEQHKAHALMCIKAAARHMHAANQLLLGLPEELNNNQETNQ